MALLPSYSLLSEMSTIRFKLLWFFFFNLSLSTTMNILSLSTTMDILSLSTTMNNEHQVERLLGKSEHIERQWRIPVSREFFDIRDSRFIFAIFVIWFCVWKVRNAGLFGSTCALFAPGQFWHFSILYYSNQMIINLITSLKVTLLPSALFLLVPCILPESPLWLIRFDMMKKYLSIEKTIINWWYVSHHDQKRPSGGGSQGDSVAPGIPLRRRAGGQRDGGNCQVIWLLSNIRFTFSLSSKRWRQLSGVFSILVISRWYQYCGHHTVIWLCKHNLL